MTESSKEKCSACKKIGTEGCPYDVELYNRDGCDEIPVFRRDIKILTLDEISGLCGLQCHSNAIHIEPGFIRMIVDINEESYDNSVMLSGLQEATKKEDFAKIRAMANVGEKVEIFIRKWKP